LAAKRRIAVSEPNLTRYDLATADEVFLTGTAAEIVPVSSIDGRIIGSGRPGLLTLKLTEDFRKLTRSEGTLIGAK
jgi:branched-chain amino acid aminotransferase